MTFVDQNEFYSCLRKSLQRMDLGQSLRDLQVRIAALKAKSEKRLSNQGTRHEFPEMKTTTAQEKTMNTLLARTDDLTKISLGVLKQYNEQDPHEMSEAELAFYNKYVAPVKHLLK